MTRTSDLYTRDPAVSSEPPREALEPRVIGLDRYEDLGLLGEGGMGEVRRVLDRDLNRVMAMKIIRPELLAHRTVVARFVEEAQCSAQLQHPGILPVHELGILPDGRCYFTMREVVGRSLAAMIEEVHAASPRTVWQTAPSGWSFRRLVDAFVKVCDAVGYAHARGVVHRDLKPSNVMVGEHGEVLVVDWGLAKVLTAAGEATADVVVTHASARGGLGTQMGAVAGTPAYMSPEQARGALDRITPRTDVYALGAILYEILSGRPPFDGPNAYAVVEMVANGAPDVVGRGPAGPPLPPELVAVCERAMARDPLDRHRDSGALAAEVTAWLDGAQRRERALDLVARALALDPQAQAQRESAAELRVEAASILAAVPTWESAANKAQGWAKQDEAARLERDADALALRVEQLLSAALQVDPLVPEAHVALVQRHRAAHVAAERARDLVAAARAEALLASHVEMLAEDHPIRASTAAYLSGRGALTLSTDPPGAEVLLHRYTTVERRLVPVFERSLGLTPLREVPLPMGSYLCVLRGPNGPGAPWQDARYPVSIGRREHWLGVPPGATDPMPVPLLRADDLGPNDVYAPPGWFWSGGDPDAADSLPRRRLWCDGLVFRRFPVTCGEYVAFLDDLVARGLEADALRLAPREKAGTPGEDGAAILGRDRQGRFVLRPDAEGDLWRATTPVTMVNWACASAFAAWEATRTGQAWRLPGELEWEKAARGADGRFFPWGDVLDPSWCCMKESHAGRPLWADVDSFPEDESPYGVRGMAGNVEDWCADVYERGGPAVPGRRVATPSGSADGMSQRSWRGGAWYGYARNARCASHSGTEPNHRIGALGFRLVRSAGQRPHAEVEVECRTAPSR